MHLLPHQIRRYLGRNSLKWCNFAVEPSILIIIYNFYYTWIFCSISKLKAEGVEKKNWIKFNKMFFEYKKSCCHDGFFTLHRFFGGNYSFPPEIFIFKTSLFQWVKKIINILIFLTIFIIFFFLKILSISAKLSLIFMIFSPFLRYFYHFSRFFDNFYDIWADFNKIFVQFKNIFKIFT